MPSYMRKQKSSSTDKLFCFQHLENDKYPTNGSLYRHALLLSYIFILNILDEFIHLTTF